MNAQELAARLDGSEYGKEVTVQDEADARAAGLVIVFTRNCGLLKFCGAIRDEVNANASAVSRIFVDSQGVIPVEDEYLSDEEAYDIVSRKQAAKVIMSSYPDPYGKPRWLFQIDIPYCDFYIFKDGDPNRAGTVFALKDAALPEPIELRAIDWLLDGDVGISSKAILAHMLGTPRDSSFRTPKDPSDFKRCLLLIALFPEWKPRLPEMAQHKGWEPLVSNWAALEAMFIDEVGRNWSKAKSAPQTYAFMKKLGL